MTDAEDNGSAGADTSTVLYDGFDRALKQTDAFGNFSLSVYDVASQVTLSQSWGPEGGNLPANSTNNKLLSQSYAKHDELGRGYESSVDRFDTPNGTILDTYTSKPRFDRRSLTILARNPRGFTSSVVYDGLGRSVLSTDAKSNTVETIYDENSHVLQTK